MNINASTIRRKINAIRNVKLKLALRLQLASGLRVFEVAALGSQDIIFHNNNSMKIIVRKGKGNKYREVDVEDPWLYDNLKNFIQGKEGKLFYTKASLKLRAGQYGIETHDLRRINAQERFKRLKEGGLSSKDAKDKVRVQLGHSDRKITSIYLKRKKVVYE